MELPIDQMVKDADRLANSLVPSEFDSGPVDQQALDVCCHVKSLAAEVERLETEADKALCKTLYEQAKKCLTASGGGLLLAIKGHLEGREVYENCHELWEVADAVTEAAKEETDGPEHDD